MQDMLIMARLVDSPGESRKYVYSTYVINGKNAPEKVSLALGSCRKKITKVTLPSTKSGATTFELEDDSDHPSPRAWDHQYIYISLSPEHVVAAGWVTTDGWVSVEDYEIAMSRAIELSAGD